jgi:hypothetical protein
MTTFEQTVSEYGLPQQVYKSQMVRIGTFLGGPLVAGYMIAENYKAFDEPDKAKKAWIYAIAATVVIFGGIFLVPESVNIPRVIIPLLYTWATYYIVQNLQGAQIDAHVNTGGLVYSWGRVIVVSLISLAATLAVIFAVALFIG